MQNHTKNNNKSSQKNKFKFNTHTHIIRITSSDKCHCWPNNMVSHKYDNIHIIKNNYLDHQTHKLFHSNKKYHLHIIQCHSPNHCTQLSASTATNTKKQKRHIHKKNPKNNNTRVG